MRTRLSLALVSLVALALAACGAQADPVRDTAQAIMDADGVDATVTDVVEGNPAVRGADELHCVATDGTTADGTLPYLLAVWRTGDDWQGAQLLEGYYEWDLQGCPR